MGPPVTSFSLAPDMGLLATAHTQRRGIYLWANQTMFGTAESAPALNGESVKAHLPALTGGEALPVTFAARPLASAQPDAGVGCLLSRFACARLVKWHLMPALLVVASSQNERTLSCCALQLEAQRCQACYAAAVYRRHMQERSESDLMHGLWCRARRGQWVRH